MEYLQIETPVGYLGLGEEEGALVRLYLPNTPQPRLASRETPLLTRAREELMEYLRGERRSFTLPLRPEGTPFQQRVWEALQAIPWGETRTYGDIARAAQCPRGFRAVGMACNRNPLPILIPCHRVVSVDGALTGYAGGLELKRQLLELEGALRRP